MSRIHVVVLPFEPAELLQRGPARVAAQSARAREALRRSAAASGAVLAALDKDAGDAPLPSNGWHWSISHAAGRAAGAVARQPLGVDVERIAPRDQGVVPRVTSRDELEIVGGFTWAAFFRVWTAKEAVLKKAGCGLAELARCVLVARPTEDVLVVLHRERHHVVRQMLRDDHVAAIAHDGGPTTSIEWAWAECAARGPA